MQVLSVKVGHDEGELVHADVGVQGVDLGLLVGCDGVVLGLEEAVLEGCVRSRGRRRGGIGLAGGQVVAAGPVKSETAHFVMRD